MELGRVQPPNENFSNRSCRSEEQVAVLKALWAEPHVTFRGKCYPIDDVGVNALPARLTVPIWFGGHAEVTMRRRAAVFATMSISSHG